MTYPNINIYVDMNEAELSEAIKGARLPENVRIVFKEVIQGFENDLTGNSVNIVITDNESRAEKLSGMKRKSLYTVFAGNRKLSDGLEDVWRKDDPDEFRIRFERLMEKVVLELRAWFFEHALKTAIDTVPDMVWIKDRNGIHTTVNEAFAKAAHKPLDEVTGKDIFSIWDIPRTAEDSVAIRALAEENAINTGKKYICDEPMVTGTGFRHLTTYTSPLYDMTGNVFGTVGVAHDITDFSNFGKELSIIMENVPFPMALFTADMKTVRMNSEFIDAAGIKPDEVDSFDFDEWEQTNLVPLKKVETDSAKHLSKQECRLHRGNDVYYYNLRRQEIRDTYDNTLGYILIMTNISYLHEYESVILNTANTDMLTG
ncbi:MAG: PAS domain S-box protein, partial [Ruminiclostridium sp.]|nr:PAS domain S-box protein [Ruminiclostridium sp.]